MPFIPAQDGIRVAITYQNADGNQANNILWFQDAASGVPATRLQTLASEVAGWLADSWADVAVISWRAVQLDLRYWNTPEDAYLVEPLSIPGLLSQDAAPSEVSIAVSLRTGLTGRSNRGRTYHVGIGDDSTLGDYITDAYRTALITAYSALRTGVTPFDFYWSVASFQTEGAPRTVAQLTPITQVTIVDNIVDSMRKRKPRAS